MKKRILSLLMLALSLTVTGLAQSSGARTPAEIAKDQSSAIVLIEQLDDSGNVIGQGSGFIVTPGGSIVTNLHVIQGAMALRVTLANGDVYKTADVVDFDEIKDVAIIKIKGFKLPVVALGDSDFAQQGETIVAISNPEGLPNSVTTGVISGMRRLETHRVFQISAPMSKGSSGGALFDTKGMVIGITSSVLQSGQNINFAVPINYARGMISDEVTTALSKLPQLASSTEVFTQRPVTVKPVASAGEAARQNETPLSDRLSNASSNRLGRSPQSPMFARPDEAMAFFYRLVDGIGKYGVNEIADLTRTAAVQKAGENNLTVDYQIPWLSFYHGVQFSLRKTDRKLSSVELMVDWSVEDLKRNLGEKFKKKNSGGQSLMELKEKRDDKQTLVIQAPLDLNERIRLVRFTKS